MPLPRPLLALTLSLALHVVAGGALVGTAVWQGWQLSQTVDLELVSTRTEQPKELPLGPPAPPAGGRDTTPRTRKPRPKPTGQDPMTLAAADGGADGGAVVDGGADAVADAGTSTDAGAGDAGRPGAGDAGADGRGARPHDLRSYGPEGSRVTALLRLDRLRTSPQADTLVPAVDRLLRLLPDCRRLIDGTGLDLYRDFDVLLIATPNPLDDAVTFLAVRHHLGDRELMSALERGAVTAGRPLQWRSEGERPVGSRTPRSPPPGRAGVVERDDRLIVLPTAGLAVIAPPAYATLLLPKRTGDDAGAAQANALHWRTLVERIDAQDGAMPDNGVLMMTAANIFRAGRPASDAGADGVPAASWDGLVLPAVITLVVGTTPGPALDIRADFERRADAVAWEREWPGRKRALLRNPAVLLAGLGPILGRVELRREEDTVLIRTTATHEELLRTLNTITTLLALPR